jgi:hypothetical protein
VVVACWIGCFDFRLGNSVAAFAGRIQGRSIREGEKVLSYAKRTPGGQVYSLASKRNKSESPRLSDCTFSDDVSYVRDRSSGELSAFVAVSLSMEDAKPGDYNNGDAVGNLQLGTAVFRFDRDHWETDGRAILNLSPSEAIRFFQKDLEKVGEEFAHRI